MSRYSQSFGVAHSMGELVGALLSVPVDLVAGLVDIGRLTSGKVFPNVKVHYDVLALAEAEGFTKSQAKTLARRAQRASKSGVAVFRTQADVQNYVSKYSSWAKSGVRMEREEKSTPVRRTTVKKKTTARRTAKGTNKNALEVSRRHSAA